MTLDFSRDYLMFHNPITISYLVKTAEGVWATGVSVSYAQRNSVVKADLPPSLLEKDVTVFHCWKTPLAGIAPKLGDKLNDGRSWLVMHVDECDRDDNGVQRYKLYCIRSNV